MDALIPYLSKIKIPTSQDKVHKEECVFSFDNPETSTGLYVNLTSFLGLGREHIERYAKRTGNCVFLHIQRERREVHSPQQGDGPEKKITRLAIGVEGGFDPDASRKRFEFEDYYNIVILPEFITIPWPNDDFPDIVKSSVKAILELESASKLAELEALTSTWDGEARIVSKYANNLLQLDNGIKIPPSSWKCEKCDKTDNLWLNLTDGSILCGRKFYDGSGGNNHAIDHYNETHHPLAVKLGTITKEGKGDVFSYVEDDMVEDPKLIEHLAHWGEPAKLEDIDSPDWIPSVNMGYTTIKTQGVDSLKRHFRSIERQTKLDTKHLTVNEVDEASTSSSGINADTTRGPFPESLYPAEVYEGRECANTQTDLDMDHINKLFKDLDFANQKIYALEDKFKASALSELSFMNNDSKTLYFTGFPKAEMMFKVFNGVASYLSSKSALSQFQQFLLTLMKLRLNLPFKYLSFRFGISPSTASGVFYKCVDVLYARYNKIVFWPDREILQKNMPACFKENFDNRVVVIIDCFEIYTETPSGMLNAARCWSNYKHHQTIKFLIGITPQGTISYISEAWGGRTSDKFLTENCGFLNLILPGDLILADRGFLIKDSVETLRGHLEIPAFTKGKNQLDPADIESTRKIANVRIHVERVIGLLKRKFKICQGPIPISMLSILRDDLSALDKILVVCSALYQWIKLLQYLITNSYFFYKIAFCLGLQYFT